MASSKKPKYHIDIEGNDYDWDEDTITVPQLRTLGNLPADQPVIEIDKRTNDETTLAEDAIVDLKPGQGFSRKIGFKRG